MKKIVLLVPLCLVFFVSFAASVWEGAAGIASSYDFPTAGNYILSNAFPKHTVVEITNLENGITIQAEVTGPLGTSGVLAAVSPDAAKNLSLRSGTVSRVRVRIPFTSAENLVFDNSFRNNDPDVNPQAAIALDRAKYGENNPEGNWENIYQVPENTVSENENFNGNEGSGDSPAESENIAAVEEPAPVVPQEVINTSEEALESKKIEENIQIVENPDVTDSSGNPEENTTEIAESAAETGVETDENRLSEKESVEVVLIPAEETVNEAEAVSEPADEIIIAGEEGLSPIETADRDLVEAETIADNVVITEEPELSVSFDSSNLEVATTPEPTLPDSEYLPEDTVDSNYIASNEDIVIPESDSVSGAGEDILEGSFETVTQDSLEKGIYIQIAALQDKNTLQDVLSKYSNDYPVKTVELNKDDKKLVRVLIGPVNRDEYGAVLERFKSFGFKDAFVSRN